MRKQSHMNNNIMQQTFRKQAKPRFRGEKTLKSRVALKYKQNTEREFIRIVNEVMVGMKKELDAEMKKIAKISRQDGKEVIHYDSTSDLMEAIEKAYRKINSKAEMTLSKLKKKLTVLANLTRKLSIADWKRVCKKTLGIDIMTDYYMGEFYRTSLAEWVDRNVDLIKSIPQNTLGEMKKITSSGFLAGKTPTEIAKEIQEAYMVNKRKAQFIARDQMAKLNGELARKQQEDAGVSKYIWSTSGDGRVRESHRKLDGKVFSWNDPPIVDEKTGRRCHPMQDYRCRCVALPVFDIEALDLPIENGGENSGTDKM